MKISASTNGTSEKRSIKNLRFHHLFVNKCKEESTNKIRMTNVPVIAIKSCTKVECHGKQPTVTMDSHKRKPIFTTHPIPGKINAQSRLRELRGNFLSWQSHLPGLSWMSIQAQIFFF